MEALHLASVGLAAAGACCVAAAGPLVRNLDLIGALLMVLAMVDAAAHLSPIPTVGWALILLTSALSNAFRHSRSHTSNFQRPPSAMTIHRNIGAILMAALLICMETHHTAGHTTDEHIGHTIDPLALTLTLGALGYAAASISLAARRTRPSCSHRAEAALMGLSVLLMVPPGLT